MPESEKAQVQCECHKTAMCDFGPKVRYLQPQQVWGIGARTCPLRVRWLRPEVNWRLVNPNFCPKVHAYSILTNLKQMQIVPHWCRGKGNLRSSTVGLFKVLTFYSLFCTAIIFADNGSEH